MATTVGDMLFLSLALFFNTFTAPAVKITQEKDGSYAYNKYCIYFIAEMIKLVVSSGWSLHMYHTDEDKRRVMKVSSRDIWQYAIPGFVFFAQNNLSFVALQHLSNAAFQLLLNMRIVAVALLTVVVLRKSLNKVKWLAIILLTNGAVQYQLSSCATGALKTSAEGLFVMVIIIACAAGGNIATQLLMQVTSFTIVYVWGCCIRLAIKCAIIRACLLQHIPPIHRKVWSSPSCCRILSFTPGV
jgi:drug/metabolite transporter (DMT)-like permease